MERGQRFVVWGLSAARSRHWSPLPAWQHSHVVAGLGLPVAGLYSSVLEGQQVFVEPRETDAAPVPGLLLARQCPGELQEAEVSQEAADVPGSVSVVVLPGLLAMVLAASVEVQRAVHWALQVALISSGAWLVHRATLSGSTGSWRSRRASLWVECRGLSRGW